MPPPRSPPLDAFISALSERDAARAESIDSSLEHLDAQISSLIREQRRLTAERRALVDVAQRVLDRRDTRTITPPRAVDYSAPADNAVYAVADVARQYWPAFENFRYCQQGVVRAVLDRRHVFVVMPTGGGKSFCYQLPALMQTGITLVISPLVSLMHDQVEHARAQHIPCDLMTAATPREDKTRINRLVRGMTPENNPPIAGPGVGTSSVKQAPRSRTVRSIDDRDEDEGEAFDDRPPKLLYVTPEQLTKNKTLRAALQNAEEAGALARIVVDEAHCCSQYGHDYRPDYRKLDLLTKFFAHTPLSCFTATAPYTVMADVIECLGLPRICSAHQALSNSTVHFSSPLIRPNLHYSVLPKSIGKEEYADVASYILSHHKGETGTYASILCYAVLITAPKGIVYCLSQKNTEDMARHVTQLSGGQIEARAYHAGMPEENRARTHRRWTAGRVHVICATTAFGMGIDKADVRFVLHTTMPTSVEGLYQESGRAGRDGLAASCILFYRPQDGVRIASLASDSPGGSDKVRAVLEYAQTPECRKVFFSCYFEDEHSNFEPCSTCDNCVGHDGRGTCDATLDAWKTLHALASIKLNHGRVTLGQLTDLVRGNNRGRYDVLSNSSEGARGPAAAISPAVAAVPPPGTCSRPGKLDMADFDGPVLLTRGNTERLIVHLWTLGLIREEYVQTPHTVNVYLDLSVESWTLRRLSPAHISDPHAHPNGRIIITVYGKDIDATNAFLDLKPVRLLNPKQQNKVEPKARHSGAEVVLSDAEDAGLDLTRLASEASSSASDASDHVPLASMLKRKRSRQAQASAPSRNIKSKSRRVTVVDSSDDGL